MTKNSELSIDILQEKNQELVHHSEVLASQIEQFQFQIRQLKSDNRSLESDNRSLESDNRSLETQLQEEIQQRGYIEEKAQHLKDEYDRVIDQLSQALRNRFGKKSESFIDTENPQLPLFETLQGEDESPDDPEDRELITYTRKKRSTKHTDGRDIPVREIIIPVDDADRRCSCGNKKKLVRYESSHRLNYQPAVFEMLHEKREVLACSQGCESNIVTAAAPKRILPKCRVTESLLAYIAVSKVLDRQPLYHLEKRIEEIHKWHISRQTMSRWLIQLADKCQPLINCMKDVICDYDCASIDATSLQVLKEPRRKAETKSEAYCIRGGPPKQSVTLYEYNAYRQSDYVVETLLGFKGYIHCDASSVFNAIGEDDDITLCYCNAHARRKFETIYKATRKSKGNRSTLAKHALKVYQALYKIERYAKDQQFTPEQRYDLRYEKSRPLLAEFYAWLVSKQDLVLPKSPIGTAIRYTLKHWVGLTAFLDDGRLEIDNNDTERDIKPFVIARKNFMFACTPAGADALGVLFSLVITARHHGHEAHQYMTDIFMKIPLCKSWDDYEALLPWNWKQPNS